MFQLEFQLKSGFEPPVITTVPEILHFVAQHEEDVETVVLSGGLERRERYILYE